MSVLWVIHVPIITLEELNVHLDTMTKIHDAYKND